MPTMEQLEASLAAALREFASPTPPKCPAHGEAACDNCSRITSGYVTGTGDCSGCEFYGSTGMHWDTCPGRIRGAIYATRNEAIGAD